MKYIIANWKANKNQEEAENWVREFADLLKNDQETSRKIKSKEIEVIIAPGFHLLKTVKDLLPPEISLSAQDVSFYERGSYTGEVPASTLSDLVKYTILGHSERRKYFHETANIIDQKADLAKNNDIEPILCLRNNKDLIPNNVFYVAYEPVEAIGSGNNTSLDEVLATKKLFPFNSGSKFFYGGSVDENNIQDYLKSDEINGFLVGTASNRAETFYKMCALL